MIKNKALFFSIAGSLLIIGFLFILNYLTSWGHPWFIYPTFAVIWWPLSIYFAGNKNWKMFAVSGSILIAVFFVLVNLITSQRFPWAIFPIYAVIWWPMSMLLCGAKRYKLYAVAASLLTAAFFYVVNMVTSPNSVWFIYPVFAVLWWPLSVIICGAKKYKLYSIISTLYTIAFFLIVNLITSPQYLWFYYPAFALIWWPLSMLFARKKTIKLYSVIMSICLVGFLALINLLNTPGVMWFQLTIFYFLWWPVVMLLGKKAKTITFSVISAIVIIAYHVIIYLLLTPGGHPWYLYILLPVVWWPIMMIFRSKIYTKAFLISSMVVFILYYAVLNLLLSPGHLWIVYLIYPFAWTVIGAYFTNRKKYFALSLWGAGITIIFFAIINCLTSPNHIWAVYPAFAVIWWPLSMYFFKVRKNKKELSV